MPKDISGTFTLQDLLALIESMGGGQTTPQKPPKFQDFGGLGPFFPPNVAANLGTVGKTDIGQVDVRTPLMQMLEAMLGQTAFNLFQNPFAFSQAAQALPGVGGIPQAASPNFEGIPGALGTDPLQQAFAQAFSGLFGGGSAPLTNQLGNQGGQPQPGPTLSGFPGFTPIQISAGRPAGPGIPIGPNFPPQSPPTAPPLAPPPGDIPRPRPKFPGGPVPPQGPLEPLTPTGDPFIPFGPRIAPPTSPSPPNTPGPYGPIIHQSPTGPSDEELLAQIIAGFGGSLPPYLNNPQGVSQLLSGLKILAGGGQLDPNAVNVVGEYGPEMVVGNQVIPFGNQPVGLSRVLPPEDIFGSESNRFPRPDPQTPQGPTSIPQFNFGQLPQFPQLPQVGGFQPGTLQGAGTGAAQRFLEANPEQQTFNLAQNQLQPLISGGGAAQGIMGALQPIFQRNLQFGLGELRNLAPSAANQALQRQGTDLTTQALQDFNLLAAQAGQQGQQTQLQGLGLLGQLAGQAGQAPFGRALQAGQLGLQESQAQTGANQQAAAQNAQNLLGGFQAQSGQALGAGQLGLQGLTGLRGQDIQREYGLRQLAQQQSQFANTFGLQRQQQAFEQQTNPSLQLLLALLGLAQPTAYQTIASQG